ncbi:MAG: hypothetical protein D6788_11375 [Planctomycetota bacterium]|nr:MAG: hypothetical protein D6788_11375 [Planctomycetota bacterium]
MSDAIRLENPGELVLMKAVGTIPGVAIVDAAPANGKGVGLIESRGDGKTLRWRAPGSSFPGAEVRCESDGDYILEDGADRGKFVRVRVRTGFLFPGPTSGSVFIDDRYENGLSDGDFTAAEAAAGASKTNTVTVRNISPLRIYDLRVWIDPAISFVAISADGVSWVSPTTEATALLLGDVAPGLATSLHIKRTISPGQMSSPKVLNRIHFSWWSLN